jgi:hypothetical protein
MSLEEAKKRAAYLAVDIHVKNNQVPTYFTAVVSYLLKTMSCPPFLLVLTIISISKHCQVPTFLLLSAIMSKTIGCPPIFATVNNHVINKQVST